jgi:hypothetical protein
MSATIEEVLQVQEDGTIVIAQPGEPIVNTTARDARRKVTSYLGREISMMMMGYDPALIYNKGRLIWRVPIALTSPMRGHIGYIGALDVDARLGELIIPTKFAKEIVANARALLKSSPYTPEE